MISSKFLRILHLVPGMRERPHLCAESLRKQDSIVPQAADPNDSDLLAGASAVGHKGREHRQPAAHHGCGMTRLDGVWDGEDELLLSANGCGVPALRHDTVGVDTILRSNRNR